MRVLHLLPTLQRRGAQVFAADLCRALHRSGVSQRLAVLAPGPDEVGFGAIPGDNPPSTLPGGWRGIMSLRGLLRTWRPQVLLAHGGEPLLPAFLARGGRGGPELIYRKIGLTRRWLRRPRWLRLRYHRCLLGRADAIAAVSTAVAEELVGVLRVPRDKVRVILQGAEPAAYLVGPGTRERVRDSLRIPQGAPVLLAVGALRWEKNQEVMVRALAAVRRAQPRAQLLFAGEGPERGRLERLAGEWGLAAAVRFLGSRSDVPELLAASDIILLSSLTEGLPGVLIEAGMAGIPAVAWDVAGVREVLCDGETGLVTPYCDEKAFADAVLRLLCDPIAARRMGAAARGFCRERFSMRRCVEDHLTLFRDVLGARR